MEKYYYQEGVCKTLSYLSLNPIVYEKEKDGLFHKRRMDCRCIQQKKCSMYETCNLFLDAPKILEDKGLILREKKL